MRDAPWTDAETAIVARPISAKAARAELVRAGFVLRSTKAIASQRARIDNTETRRLVRTLLMVARWAYQDKPYRSSLPFPSLLELIELGLVKRPTSTTYRPTLAGIAWLADTLGSDWERELEPPSEELPESTGGAK